ncbi:MAG: hypothetical protein IPJ93_09400 [Bacteroidota bacterium]|nr:MAG: hypothetical protein IPJ93_09400 [Bacteroidota bacterium]
MNIFKNIRLKGNASLPVFFICVFVSLVFWILYSLNKNYVYPVTYTVTLQNTPFSKQVISEIPQQVNVTLRSRGFELFWYLIRNRERNLTVDLKKYSVNNEKLGISLQSEFRNQNQNRLKEMDVVTTLPDSVWLYLSSKYMKTVPVVTQFTYSIKKNFGLSGKVSIAPDSITISGEKSQLDGVNEIKTVATDYDNLDRDLKATLSLISPAGKVNLSQKEIKIHIPVEEFIEKKIPVVLNYSIHGSGKVILIPEKAELIIQVPLKRYEQLSADSFQVTVSAKRYLKEGQLAVELIHKPQGINVSSIVPSTVNYFIER